ncbi:uncharacterized protein METZ01_LOCUS466434, partial [marine metagenome]
MAQSSTVKERVKIALDEPLGLLDYSVPPELQSHIDIGYPVKVPLGNRHANGYIAQIVDSAAETPPTEFELRPIEQIDDSRPTLPRNLIELILFTADYYATQCGDVLHAALPAAARTTKTKYALSDAGKKALEGKLTDAQQQILEYGQTHAD